MVGNAHLAASASIAGRLQLLATLATAFLRGRRDSNKGIPVPAIPQELHAHLASLPKSRGQRLASLTDWAFVRLMDRAIDAIGIDKIVATVLAAYDQYIVPLDLPVLTEGQEATFDASVKVGLDLALRGFHDFIHAKAKGPLMGAAPRTWIGEAA